MRDSPYFMQREFQIEQKERKRNTKKNEEKCPLYPRREIKRVTLIF